MAAPPPGASRTGASTNRMLQGVRVVSFTNAYAGPYAGRLLAQHGAEVIKIESQTGGLDIFRYYGKYEDINRAPRFIECNLGIRSVTVNLKNPIGVRLIKEMVAKSDALVENFRPLVLARLGLSDEELRKINPGIVMLKMPGLGERGPKSQYGTWGFNLTSFSGMTYLWNHPGQDRPIGSQGVYPDHLAFMMAPTLLVAALLRRRMTGQGVSIDLAQAEATAYALGVTYLETAINQTDPQPRGNRDLTAAPHGCYRCRGEDRWCVISVRTDEEWQKFCRIAGRAELATDPKFADAPSRRKHAAELEKIVGEWTRLQTPEDVMRRLQAEEIPAGVAQAGDDLVADPQLRHRNYFARFDDSPVGPMEIPRSALQFEGMIDEPLTLPPRLGADTDAVLRDLLGYDGATIEQWKKEGVLS